MTGRNLLLKVENVEQMLKGVVFIVNAKESCHCEHIRFPQCKLREAIKGRGASELSSLAMFYLHVYFIYYVYYRIWY